ncbi:MAG: ATP-binding protein [Thermotogota bacterium]|nr:ATP-binding protein [Thermotogota bacterium]
MNTYIERRPTFPMGTPYLGLWIIHHPLFCTGNYEVYSVQDDSKTLFGIVIRCRTQEEASQQKEQHLTWWQLQGKNKINILANDIRVQDGWYLFLACIVILHKIISFEDFKISSLNQVQAESLISNLITVCKLAHTHGINPVINIGTTLLVEQNNVIDGIPLFVKTLTLSVEKECVKSIAELVYFFTTGIDIFRLISESGKKTAIPPANRWNKNINQWLSLLLSSCFDFKDPQRIISLNDLQMRLTSGQDVAQPTEEIQQNQKPLKHSDSKNLKGLAKVAGMSALKELLIEEVIRPIRDPEPYKKYGLTIPNGILLYGPPGCGKTFIARQLAEELDFYFIELIPSEIASSYIHRSVLKIRDIFAAAEQHAPSIVFIDECEALVPARSALGGEQQYKSEEVNEFLVHLDECASKNIFVIAATNEPDKIDEAIKRTGRLDKMIYVEPPDSEARIQLLEMYLSGRPLGKVDIGNIASLLEGYSCSDIRNIANESARLAFREEKAIDNNYLEKAIDRNPSSLSPDILLKYKKFQQRGI